MTMPSVEERTRRFRALHRKGEPFILANAWDQGSARIVEGLGFLATATSSAGFALTLGRKDYGVSRAEAIGHGRALAEAVSIPVSADLENGFGPSADDAAATIREAATTGLAGGSIEDFSGDADAPILELALAAERVAAASEAARASKRDFVLTARAEAYLHGRGDLDEVIERLQRFQDAGADVLFAPGLPDLDAVKAVCSSLDRPVNVIVTSKLARYSLDDFANAGAARISLGANLAAIAYGALTEAGSIMARDKTFGALANNAVGAKRLRKWLRQDGGR